MKRLWSLLTPTAGGRRRSRGILVLALAVLVPLAVLLTLVPQRGTGDAVPAALVNLDMPVQESVRSEEHTSELQSLMRISYAVFCLKKKKKNNISNMKMN